MFSWFRQWIKFENQSIFEVKVYEVKAYKKVCQFLGNPVCNESNTAMIHLFISKTVNLLN